MLKQGGKNLMTMPVDEVKAWLGTIDTIITDCDGVLWNMDSEINGSVAAINALVENGKQIYFCTNNSTKTRKALFDKATQMGYVVKEENILSTAYVTALYLKRRNFNKKAYIVGGESIAQEMDNFQIKHSKVGPDPMASTVSMFLLNGIKLEKDIGAVVVGFDEHFSFPKMIKAATYLKNPDCEFLATNMDENFKVDDLIVPSSGGFVRAIQGCSDRLPMLVGKPNPFICRHLMDELVISPGNTLMIGDRGNTDILLGYHCGFYTMLVETGVHKAADIETWKNSQDPENKKMVPDLYIPKLGDIVKFL